MHYQSSSGVRERYVLHPAKIIKRLSLILLLTFICFQFSFAQFRPNINSLNVDPTLTTAQEQQELACAIKTFLDANHDFIELHLTPNIHTTPNFLIWHRFYIEKLEEHLTSIGLDKYVPLPMWNPTTTVPAAFCTGSCRVANNPADGHVTFVSTLNCGPCSDFEGGLGTLNCTNYPTMASLSSAMNGPHGSIHGCVQPGAGFHQATGNPWFFIWHAFVDDVWNKWERACAGIPNGPDLYMKDINHDKKVPMSDGLDMGYEPFVVTVPLGQLPIYNSEDVWNRVTNDGIANQEHEDPDFSSTQPNYLYVRVRNRGSQTSNGTEELKLYWTKAAGANSWPTVWINHMIGSVLHGDIIPTSPKVIPALAPGQTTIIEFEWYPPNPASFSEVKSHICLLARIETSTTAPYGMTFTEGSDVALNVVNNNNIIWKNMWVVNNPGNGLMKVRLGNPCDHAAVVNFRFDVPAEAQGNVYIDEGDYVDGANLINLGPQEMFTKNGLVTVDLGPDLYAKWAAGGKQGDGIADGVFTHIDEEGQPRTYPIQYLTGEEAPYTIAITGPNATLGNIQFAANEIHTAAVRFNYFVQPANDIRADFTYNVHQEVIGVSDCSGIGGEAFKIKRPTCPKPEAGANITIGPGCMATLTANPIVSGASYTWFKHSNGQYVGAGQMINVSPTVTTVYELQMVLPNGCIGYDIVTVIVDPALAPCNWCFHDLAAFPNPVATDLTVRVTTDESTHLSISLMTITGEVLQLIEPQTQPGINDFVLNVSAITPGIYKLSTQCVNGSGIQIETIEIRR